MGQPRGGGKDQVRALIAPGRPRGRLAIVGIGPGQRSWRTPEATAALAAADDVVGYGLYLDLIADLDGALA